MYPLPKDCLRYIQRTQVSAQTCKQGSLLLCVYTPLHVLCLCLLVGADSISGTNGNVLAVVHGSKAPCLEPEGLAFPQHSAYLAVAADLPMHQAFSGLEASP